MPDFKCVYYADDQNRLNAYIPADFDISDAALLEFVENSCQEEGRPCNFPTVIGIDQLFARPEDFDETVDAFYWDGNQVTIGVII